MNKRRNLKIILINDSYGENIALEVCYQCPLSLNYYDKLVKYHNRSIWGKQASYANPVERLVMWQRTTEK